MIHGLDLFTGIGGFSLALKLYFGGKHRTVCYVEWDKYCQQVIQARIKDGCLDDAPIWDDIQSFDGRPWNGCVDIITAGFPCQPYSVAGKQKGEADERNLWPALRRVISEVGPRYVLLENVPGLLAHDYFGTILGELASCGYRVRWDCVSASAIGANHQRDRLWIIADARGAEQPLRRVGEHSQTWQEVADADSTGRREQCGAVADGAEQFAAERSGGGKGEVADASSAGLPEPQAGEQQFSVLSTERGSWWATEPDVGRVAHGVSKRVDRLKALGNSIVPAVAAEFLRLMEI